MATLTTPNMNLTLPVVSSEPGPAWATEINTALGALGGGIDAHNHTSGKGVQVPSAGIGINADLGFNSYRATSLAAVQLAALSGAPTAALGQLHVLANGGYADLYYNTGTGGIIPLVSSGSLVGNINGFYGNYAASASAWYKSSGGPSLFPAGYDFLTGTTYALTSLARVRAGTYWSRSPSSPFALIATGAADTGGWALATTGSGGTASMQVAFDSANNGTWSTLPFTFAYLSGFAGTTYGLGINTTPSVPVHVWGVNSNGGVQQELMRLVAHANGATPGAGYGVKVQMNAQTASSGTTGDGVTQAQMLSYWQATGGANYGAWQVTTYNNSGMATSFDVKQSATGWGIGLGGAAAALTNTIQAFGDLVPSGTQNLGTAGVPWVTANVTTANVTTANITTANITTATLTTLGATSGNITLSAGGIIPTTNGAAFIGTSTHGLGEVFSAKYGMFNNSGTYKGDLGYDSFVAGAAAISAAGVVSNSSGYINIAVSGHGAGSGSYTLHISPASTGNVIALVSTSGLVDPLGAGFSAAITRVDASTFKVYTWAQGSALGSYSDADFSVLFLGAGF